MSELADWSDADVTAVLANIADETERCSGCGLRADQFPYVEADISSCPGCEAAARAGKNAGKDTAGVRIGFFPVNDSRDSVWARFTKRGSEWASQHRRHAGTLVYRPDDGG